MKPSNTRLFVDWSEPHVAAVCVPAGSEVIVAAFTVVIAASLAPAAFGPTYQAYAAAPFTGGQVAVILRLPPAVVTVFEVREIFEEPPPYVSLVPSILVRTTDLRSPFATLAFK